MRLLLVSVFVVGACVQAPATHTVSWVVDGDTFYVDSLESSVRIADIDAPELGTEQGELVKWFMIELVYGKDVVLDCDGVDVYGRHLCLVYVDVDGRLVSVSDILLAEFDSVRRWR